MIGEVFGIAAFRSRQQVLLLNQQLRREGIPAQVISTPRDVAVGCGLSVRFSLEDTDRVRRVIDRVHVSHMIGLYRVERSGGKTRLSTLSLRP